MHKRFLSYIKNEALFSKADPILIAVSGGMDSMTLCEMMRINQFNFAIAHFNHVTRNGESDLDEEFVRSYALKHAIPFFYTRVDINKVIELQHGGNFQNLARAFRYDWLEDIRSENKFKYIATAHHHNDQIETFLFHFSRGTGLDGLTGIASKQNYLVRPMLGFTRSEIESYIYENKVNYRIDSSNSNSKYSRNYIRHGIIPSFKILNENFENNANTTMENLRAAKALYNHMLERFSASIVNHKGNNCVEISTSEFIHSPIINKQLCFELVRQYGFNSAQVGQIIDSLDQRGKTFFSDEFILLIESDQLLVHKKEKIGKIHCEVIQKCEVTGYGNLFIENISPMEIYPQEPFTEYIDAEKVIFPLILRNKEDGDRFTPLGMKGRSKKLKDFFTDLKLNKFEKEKVLVLVNKKRIIWVVGHRLSDSFKITRKTKKVLKLIWKPV